MTDQTTQTPPQDQPTETPPVAIPATPADTTPADLAAVRDLALRAHPDAVPELVGGATLAELMASLEPARAAYRRIVEARPSAPTPPPAPTVPAGAAPPLALDPDRLPATEKIRRGLASKR